MGRGDWARSPRRRCVSFVRAGERGTIDGQPVSYRDPKPRGPAEGLIEELSRSIELEADVFDFEKGR